MRHRAAAIAPSVGSGGLPVTRSLVGWWDASDESTITQVGGLVSRWGDKSGEGHHLTAAAGEEPTSGASTVNGLNVLDYSVGKTLVNSVYVEDTRCTTFAVIKVAASNSGQQAVCFQNQQHPITITDTEAISAYNGNFWNGSPSSAPGQVGVRAVSSRIHANPGERWVRVEGVRSDGTNNVAAAAATRVAIGGNPGIGSWLVAGSQVMEVLIFSDLAAPLSADEIADVEAYLRVKWGLWSPGGSVLT